MDTAQSYYENTAKSTINSKENMSTTLDNDKEYIDMSLIESCFPAIDNVSSVHHFDAKVWQFQHCHILLHSELVTISCY